MIRMTKDREATIRTYLKQSCFSDGRLSASNSMLFDCLAEIDRLRALLAEVGQHALILRKALEEKP